MIAAASAALVSTMLFTLSARTVTLEEAQRTAEANHPRVRQAAADVRAGDARVEQARAPSLPQVQVKLGYDRTTGNRVQKPGRSTVPGNPTELNALGQPTMSTQTYNFWQGEATASMVLWDFGQNINRWKAAEERAAALGDSERAVRFQVVVGARAAFFRARAEKALVDVARETLANEERHFQQVQGFVQAGSRPEIDLAQVRATRATRKLQLITAENGYTLARVALNHAMGVKASADYDVADETLAPLQGELGPLEALVDEAVRARPEVAALDGQLRAQALTAKAARGAYLPVLSAEVGAADAGVHLFPEKIPAGSDLSPTYKLAWNYFGGLRLTWPLFQGFLTRGQVREADAALDSLSAQRDALVQEIWVGVQEGAAAVRSAKEAVTAADEALTGARERLRLAEGRYAAGAGNIIELSDAQTGATNAAAQRVGAEYQLAAARAELAAALGRK